MGGFRLPWALSTPQPALDAAADGDTVLVKPGEYVIAEPLRFNRLHDAGNPASPPLKDLVLRAEGAADGTVLRGVDGLDSVILFGLESWRSVLDGFTVTGGNHGIRGEESLELAGPAASATILRCVVRDNRSSGIDSQGGLVFATTGGSLYSKQAGASYRFALKVPAPGSYRAWMWWSGFPSRPSSARVDVAHAEGTSSVRVNQQVNAGQWNELGTWDFEATAVITIFAASLGSTCADAVRLTPGSAVPPHEDVIDNGEAGTMAVGYWALSGGASPYGTSSLYSKQPGATYSYSFDVPAVAEYEVYLWWTAYASRPSSVMVELSLGTGETRTLSVNQTLNASRWNSLGTHVLSGRATVTIRASGTGSTCADAARIVRRGGG